MNDNILQKLLDTVEERKASDPSKSYVASLFAGGSEKIGRKVTEEATEVLVAALVEGEKELINESADLLFHLMVLLSHKNIDISEVLKVLEERMGISGLDEKAARIAKEKGK